MVDVVVMVSMVGVVASKKRSFLKALSPKGPGAQNLVG